MHHFYNPDTYIHALEPTIEKANLQSFLYIVYIVHQKHRGKLVGVTPHYSRLHPFLGHDCKGVLSLVFAAKR